MEPVTTEKGTSSPSSAGSNDDAVGEGTDRDDGQEVVADSVTINREDKKGLELLRTVSLLGATSFTVGMMIGSGIFISPTSVLRNAGSVALTLIVWTIGGFLALLGSLTISELACRCPQHGGIYAYLRDGVGSWMAFDYAVTSVLFLSPSGAAVKSLTFSRYMVSTLTLCGMPDLPIRTAAITLLLTLYIVNVVSIYWSVKLNEVFLFGKVFALVFIIIGGFYALASGRGVNSELSSGFEGTADSPAAIVKSLYFVSFAYSGWSSSNYIAEEVKNPKRNIPLAAILGVVLVTVVYVLTNLSYLAVMSRADMLSADTVAVTWSTLLLGSGVYYIMPLCVMISTAGSTNISGFKSSRLIFAAARDGNFPEVLSYIHVNRRVPIISLTLNLAFAMVYVLTSSIARLIEVSLSLSQLFYAAMCVSLLVMRRRQASHEKVPFKQPVLVIVLFLLLSLFLYVMPLVEDVLLLLYSAIAFVVLTVVFFLFKFVSSRTLCCDGVVTWVQLLLQVCPAAAFQDST